jgi:phosphonate degradation associated HDIG domain protein
METCIAQADVVYQTLASLFNRFGDEQYGEDVTQKQHMLQCAFLAEQEGESDDIIVASLLHDVGHFIGPQDASLLADGTPDEDFKHEVLGARFLTKFFGKGITVPIQLHVAAKRYLCAVKDGYYQGLSEASKHSLRLQGGPMTPEQVSKFEQGPYFQQALRVRYFDDYGKQVGLQIPDLDYYRDRIMRISLASN